MFFSFSRRKLINIGALLATLAVIVTASLFLGNRFSLKDASSLYTRSMRENLSYWWSNKVFGQGLSQSVSYQNGEGQAESIPVLVYHGLPNEGSKENPFNVSNFSEQMSVLNGAGWHTITLNEFEKFIRGEITLPKRSFLLTFDDGRKDTFYPADPVLKDLGMNAVMFAITKRSIAPTADQSPYYLSTYELKNMEKSDRWEVESHGRDSHDWYYINNTGSIGHFFSNLFWLTNENRQETAAEFKDRIDYDLSASKSDLETTLGKKITAIAFPFGDYGQDGENYPSATEVVQQEVPKYYDFAFYQAWKGDPETFNYPSKTNWMMRRIEPLGDWSGSQLLTTLESGIAKDLPYEAEAFGNEWISSWGDIKRGDVLTLAATSDGTGASISLNGSWLWKDYTFSTDVKWTAGSNVVLIARKSDKDSYFGCNFDANHVYIKASAANTSRNLIDTPYKVLGTSRDVNLGIEVKGGSIACLVNHQVVLQGQSINNRIANGGISLEVWDEKNGVAKATFDNVVVSTE